MNSVEGSVFELNIVPHTAAQTIIQHYRAGTAVNLEVDLLARYLERLMQAKQPVKNGISMATLAENGFLRARK